MTKETLESLDRLKRSKGRPKKLDRESIKEDLRIVNNNKIPSDEENRRTVTSQE